MRQAGRYLPEYMNIRKNTPDFLSLCYNPELASEVTLQPIRRFNFDAAIIFSDILVIPDALGQRVSFQKDHGPILDKITSFEEIKITDKETFINNLSKVYEAIALTREMLPKEKPLIGFAGAPWTLATYMIEGGSSKQFSIVKNLAYNSQNEFSKLIDFLTDTVIWHLKKQIESGVSIVQIFDSWAGVLNKENYDKWVIKPMIKIVEEIKKTYPQILITGFPKDSQHLYKNYVEETKVDIISLDSNISRKWIVNNLPENIIYQGNLDPIYLLGSKEKIKEQVEKILEDFAGKNLIFNLGHGILPNTPIENVEYLVETIHKL